MKDELNGICEHEYYAELVQLLIEKIKEESEIISKYPDLQQAVEHMSNILCCGTKGFGMWTKEDFIAAKQALCEAKVLHPKIKECGNKKTIDAALKSLDYSDSMAEGLYRKLTELEPNNYEYSLGLCRALLNQGKICEAEKTYNGALAARVCMGEELELYISGYHLELCTVLINQGRTHRARKKYKVAKKHWECYSNQGQTRLEKLKRRSLFPKFEELLKKSNPIK